MVVARGIIALIAVVLFAGRFMAIYFWPEGARGLSSLALRWKGTFSLRGGRLSMGGIPGGESKLPLDFLS